MYEYQQTLLYCYKYLDRTVEEYSRLIDYNALYSKCREYSTAEIASDVLRLIYDKNTLSFVKEKMDEVLSKLNEEDRLFLKIRYYYGKTENDVYSKGRYYRKNAKLLFKLFIKFNLAGLNEKFFKENCMHIPLFSEVYLKVNGREKMRKFCVGG